jgi:hypothetical protein
MAKQAGVSAKEFCLLCKDKKYKKKIKKNNSHPTLLTIASNTLTTLML